MIDLAENLAPRHRLHDEPWTGIRHGHGLDSIVGYVVRRTYFDGRPHRDIRRFDGAASYGEAVEVARQVRAAGIADGYAVVDSLHQCGCRELG